MKKRLQIGNLIALVVVIAVNYLSNTGMIANQTIGEVSDQLNNSFTPAGYTFSIWGLIYLLLIGFAVYQAKGLWNKSADDSFVNEIGWWFMISCLANCIWIVCWLNLWVGWSLIAMLILLISLLAIVLKNRMELWDAPNPVIFFLWWPFVIYSGWITVATVANVAAYLTWTNWDGWGLDESTWTVIMIGIAGLINLVVTWLRNMREFALVGAWALFGIAAANAATNPGIQRTAIITGIILLLSSTTHALINWKTSPLYRMIRPKK
ncbi:hypothetical protein [Aureitalea marina]|uniref:Tryptophan-rich sensory protein n=1 Tax=Aureitalea marina TaxID=930804 RepID=A0A2S7KRL5_9FLAO|nr:hypothetical protein [Aureitalea marina]PQB05275.1 hypothetical protein BST85_10550 [Aureitalea marina]